MTIPAPDTLRARALDMVPQLRARADECATGRRIPQANLDELFEAGLFNAVKPRAYGGYEMGMDVFCDLVMIIASGCGSTGWVYCVVGSHPTFVVNYGKEVQDEVWADTPNALISSAKMLEGSFRRVDGGYRGSGVMTFSSGCLHADWIFAGGNPVEGRKKPITVLLEKSQVEILDTWHVLGLEGTGSHDIRIEDVFVPDRRAFEVGAAPGAGLHDAPLYKGGHRIFGPCTLASVVTGIADGALQTFVADMAGRASRFGDKIADFQSLQLRVAESAAEIDAAKALIRKTTQDTMVALEDVGVVSPEQQSRNALDAAYCAQLALRSVERIFYAAGANALFKGTVLERSFRDLTAGSRQFGLSWDVQATNYGRVALGAGAARPMLPG